MFSVSCNYGRLLEKCPTTPDNLIVGGDVGVQVDSNLLHLHGSDPCKWSKLLSALNEERVDPWMQMIPWFIDPIATNISGTHLQPLSDVEAAVSLGKNL